MKQLIFCLLVLVMGCETVRPTPSSDWHLYEVSPFPNEVPVANLPKSLHQRNWVDHKDSGSCVIASSVYAMRWMGDFDMARRFRQMYAGGQTASSILRYYADNNIECVYTSHGDPEFLRWVSRNRLAAIIWWKPSHCCTFVGISEIDGVEYAVIQDNNSPGRFEKTEFKQFVRMWRGYGGFSAVPMVGAATSRVPAPSIKRA